MNEHDQPTFAGPVPTVASPPTRPIPMLARIAIGCSVVVSILSLFFCGLVSYPLASNPIVTSTGHKVAVATKPSTHQQRHVSTTIQITATSIPTATPIPTDTPAAVTDTPTPTSVPTDTPTPNDTPTAIPTAAPQPTPPPAPTPQPAPPPVPTPTPKPACVAVNNNPWCYNFTPGNVITSPPAAFCSYFSCIPNFPNGVGYVEECQDGMYSLSGGRSGSCSHHGGNLQPLYSH